METGLCKDPQTVQDCVLKYEMATDMKGSTRRPSKMPTALDMTRSGRLLHEISRNFAQAESHKPDGVHDKPFHLPALEAGNPRSGEAGVAPSEVVRENQYQAGQLLVVCWCLRCACAYTASPQSAFICQHSRFPLGACLCPCFPFCKDAGHVGSGAPPHFQHNLILTNYICNCYF